MKINKQPKDLQNGFVFKSNNCGQFIIEEYISSVEILVRFKKTGYKRRATAPAIRKGEVLDRLFPLLYNKGYMGEGPFTSKSRSYMRWASMLERCYNPKYLEKHPTYVGCYVDRSWLNFQTFSRWFEENYPKDGKNYSLDKDIKIQGNKVYSEDTCVFVSQKDNVRQATSLKRVFKDPKGTLHTVYNLSEFCKKNNLCKVRMRELSIGKSHSSTKGWRYVPKLQIKVYR